MKAENPGITNTAHGADMEAMTSRLGRMVEDSLNEIYVFDAESLKFVQVNRGARENLGYTMDELRALTALDLKPEFTAELYDELVRPLRDGTRDSIRFDTMHRRKDGSVYNVEVRLQLMATEQPPVFIAYILDVTERIRTEEQLRQAQKMEAIGRLTGGVAHDFNNILTVVQGNLELLEGMLDSDDQRNLVRRAIGASERAAMLTHRLLAFGRKQPLRPRTIDVNHLVRGMKDMLVRTLGEKIRVETRLSDDIYKTAIDPAELESALLNLAVNARDAMPDGGTLTIETGNIVLDEKYAERNDEVEPGEYVFVSVIDNGEGMQAEILETAFEPFVTTKEVGAGSGLGLSMVYGFVRQSGGHAKIYSRPGAGTTVRIHLPRQSTAPDEFMERIRSRDTPRARGETVLVVEDDEGVRALAVCILENLGYVAIGVEDGPAALNMIQQSGYIDAIFTDVVLPNGMSGFDLAAAARDLRPGIKVLFTSGYSGETMAGDTLQGETATLIQKPYNKSVLAKNLRQLLDSA